MSDDVTETAPDHEVQAQGQPAPEPETTAADAAPVEAVAAPEPERKALRAWAALKGSPEWQIRAAETVAAMKRDDVGALTEDDFDAAMKRVA